ncbi:carotenoid oxygenase family protein [Leptolyngbya sp. FACHB-36]|uniref:carotenoid oxygenase family protein n=1 Tax=Leptolyngbya sp. FACHB-36 TaxID=2692808 RepID=UPI0016808814|nr:carotenoid oxygenase family protein [Leptolyngbya sp. FACHB-36]MBD2020241.1 carotenoid oxygenase family protein [Leptolyngbya sp. FACHB-36]
MVNTLQPTHTHAWSNLMFQSAIEFASTPLTVLSGAIPTGLRGSLYRNGPGTLERGGDRVGHWFDGDGGILGIHFTDADATGVYRFVQTAGYQDEEKAGKFLYGGYGMLPPGPLWERFGKELKNVANTSVLALPDKLLALWEGGLPYALNLDSLETIGLDDLGSLKGVTYSAHPKVDPQTGDIFNFGVSLGASATLNLYRSDATGAVQQRGSIPLQGLPIIHDCVLAGRYLIFCVPPVRINAFPVLFQLKSFSHSMTWQPEQGTEILVIDRATLELVSRARTEPWYQWHFGNGYETDDGSVVLSVMRYEDFQTNQNLREIATGQIQTPARATFWHLRLDPQTAEVLETYRLVDRACEFPVVSPAEVGQPSRYTYLNIRRQASANDDQELFGAIARFDHETGTLTEADLGANRYPSEPIYAPDASDPGRGWILTVVYDGNAQRSELWVYASDRLNEEPVCTLALPQPIPFSFHGTWKPA